MMTKHKWIVLIFIGLVALLALAAQPVSAQEPVPTPSDNDVNQVAKEMYCPVCENIPLDVCPTQACSEWRELIRLKLSEGWTTDQIKDYFAVQYGDRVLSEPPRRGLNWLVYVLPPVFFAIGALIVWRVLATMKRRHEAVVANEPPPAAPAPEDPYLAELEAELKRKQ